MDKILVWKCNYISTTEFTTVKQTTSIKVEGNITGQGIGKLFHVKYSLDINNNWEIQSFRIDFISDTSFYIELQKNAAGEWVTGENEVRADLKGCTDIDISLTPFTNTLPIKRLDLPVGASKDICVVYIDLPENGLKPAKQQYTNLGNGIYKYESLETGFTANLKIDKDGFVTDYPGIWHRVTAEDENQLRHQEVFSSALISRNNLLDSSQRIYDFLIGSWDVQSIDHLENGQTLKQEGEWHFAHVLEGRAIQDVWIAPDRKIRDTANPTLGNRYGTSFRYFDSVTDQWIITWFNPVTGANNKLAGWKQGDIIIQEGQDEHGNLIRWSFKDITHDSFHWTGELSRDQGQTFVLEAEFFAKKNSM